MRFGFLNHFEATVVGSLTAGATSLPINAGGDRFADASTDKQYTLVLAERDIRGRDIRREIVYVTGRADNTLTVIRGRENTTAQSWPAGTPVEARLTAGQLANMGVPDDIAQALVDHVGAADPHTQYEQKQPGSLAYVQQVTIRSGLLNLLDGSAAVTVAVPAGYRLFLDAIDLVVVDADGAGGAPEVQAGPDSGDPAAYLGSSAVTVSTVGERDVFAPLVNDGLTAVRIATSAPGTGTTFQARALLRGYLLEL